MSTERTANALKSMNELAGRIRSSMRFGVPLPVDCTKGWAQELERIEAELRDCMGITVKTKSIEPANNRAVKDFTVVTHHY